MKYLVYFLVLANVAYLGWNIHLNQTTGGIEPELPALPAGVTPLVTLHELEQQEGQAGPAQEAEDLSAVEALTNSRPPGAGAALVCQTIGPFQAMADLQAVAKELDRHGLPARQRISERRKPNGFWVYLPAMGREQVLQAVKTLEENRDREYYVGKGNFVSLGTFDEMSRAEVRLEETRKLGFDPVLEARYQTSTEYWLDINAQTSAADALDAIMQERSGLQLQDTACP